MNYVVILTTRNGKNTHLKTILPAISQLDAIELAETINQRHTSYKGENIAIRAATPACIVHTPYNGRLVIPLEHFGDFEACISDNYNRYVEDVREDVKPTINFKKV
jgi:hypothetical protein